MKFNRHNLIAVFISIIFVALILHNINFKEFAATIKQFNYKILLIAVPVYILSIYMRGKRWQQLLEHKIDAKTIDFAQIFNIGTAMNIYLPARAGDFFRAYFVGRNYKLSKLEVFGSIILERILDGITIVMLLFIAIILSHKTAMILKIGLLGTALFFGGFAICFILLKNNKYFCTKVDCILDKLPHNISEKIRPVVYKIQNWVNSLLGGFHQLNNPKNTAKAIISSTIAWICESIFTFLIFSAFGLKLNFIAAIITTCVLALAAIIPSTSVFVGPYQYAYILSLGMYNIEKSKALAISLVHQANIMLIVTAIAIFFILKSHLNINNYRAPEE